MGVPPNPQLHNIPLTPLLPLSTFASSAIYVSYNMYYLV